MGDLDGALGSCLWSNPALIITGMCGENWQMEKKKTLFLSVFQSKKKGEDVLQCKTCSLLVFDVRVVSSEDWRFVGCTLSLKVSSVILLLIQTGHDLQ